MKKNVDVNIGGITKDHNCYWNVLARYFNKELVAEDNYFPVYNVNQ